MHSDVSCPFYTLIGNGNSKEMTCIYAYISTCMCLAICGDIYIYTRPNLPLKAAARESWSEERLRRIVLRDINHEHIFGTPLAQHLRGAVVKRSRV